MKGMISSFNIISWKMSDIKRLDTKIRKMLTMEKMHHAKADVDRLYPPRTEGVRSLAQLELIFKTIGLDTYLASTEDPLLTLMKYHEERKKLFSIKKEVAKSKQELNLPEIPTNENEGTTKNAHRVKVKEKQQSPIQMQKTLEEKAMHVKYLKRIKDIDVNYAKTTKWLKVMD
jgi:DNA-dependent RNA polymerase auxiliary subunit epsilon